LDIVPVPAERVEEILAVDAALPVLALGYRTLLDKDRLFADLPDRVAAADPWAITDAAPWPPDPAEAANLIGDYWYHCVWITKKLRRGEVWVAQGCLNGYQRRILLRFVEWQAKLRSGGQAQTWFDGRYLERWAAPETVEALRDAFARHDERDVARGLLASVAAFAPLGREVAAGVSIPYPDEAEAWISRWVADRLGEAGLV
ncbi:MAG: aminoglycoside 6-adenylyltransferase, partial [Dehalococcoidia bacterium]